MKRTCSRLPKSGRCVDRLSERYAALKSDADAQAALSEWNSAANTSFTIKPSSYFLNSVKKLEQLEKTVVSEKIPLRREGNSYYATAVINGKAQEMIVDTGASSVVLPYKVAVECGWKPEDSTIPIIATVADGSKVKSKLAVLDSVRVGKFKAEHVECCVLPEDAKNAPLLLGMTFLSKFNFSINGNELVLSKIDSELHGDPAQKDPREQEHPQAAKERQDRHAVRFQRLTAPAARLDCGGERVKTSESTPVAFAAQIRGEIGSCGRFCRSLICPTFRSLSLYSLTADCAWTSLVRTCVRCGSLAADFVSLCRLQSHLRSLLDGTASRRSVGCSLWPPWRAAAVTR